MKSSLSFLFRNFCSLMLGIWVVLISVTTMHAQPTSRIASEVNIIIPAADLVAGSDGNSYGTAGTGGSNGTGTFFRITPAGVTTVLYNFTDGSDGGAPNDVLIAGGDGCFYGTTTTGGYNGIGTAFQVTTTGTLTMLFSLGGTTGTVTGFVRDSGGQLYGTSTGDRSTTIFKLLSHPAFFDGQTALGSEVYYLSFPGGTYFGYYTFLTDADYIYHFDLGFEYVFDAHDGQSGVYFYDFTSDTFFYTSPSFPFPYLYDFRLNTFLYYFPNPQSTGHYNTKGQRYFYRFDIGQIIVK